MLENPCHRIAALVLGLATLTACGPAPLPPLQPLREDVLVVVVDQSRSLTCDAAGRARRVRAAVERQLRASSGRPLHVLVYGTGSAPGHEPPCLVPWTMLQESAPVMFGDPEAGREALEAGLDGVERSCAVRGTDTDSSAILLALDRATQSLRAMERELTGRGVGEVVLHLAIQADMRENVDAAMKARIARAARGNADLGTPPLVLPTKGIVVSACGVADSDGRGQAQVLPADALRRAWRDVLGEGAPEAWDGTCDADARSVARKAD